MPLSMALPGILIELRAGLSNAPDLPCASCLFGLGDASGMAGAEPCPLRAKLLRRYAQASATTGGASAVSCAGFAPGYAQAGEDRTSDIAGGATRILS